MNHDCPAHTLDRKLQTSTCNQTGEPCKFINYENCERYKTKIRPHAHNLYRVIVGIFKGER